MQISTLTSMQSLESYRSQFERYTRDTARNLASKYLAYCQTQWTKYARKYKSDRSLTIRQFRAAGTFYCAAYRLFVLRARCATSQQTQSRVTDSDRPIQHVVGL